jgi:hypothetical protein
MNNCALVPLCLAKKRENMSRAASDKKFQHTETYYIGNGYLPVCSIVFSKNNHPKCYRDK